MKMYLTKKIDHRACAVTYLVDEYGQTLDKPLIIVYYTRGNKGGYVYESVLKGDEWIGANPDDRQTMDLLSKYNATLMCYGDIATEMRRQLSKWKRDIIKSYRV